MFSPEGAQEAGMMTNAGSSRTVAICDSQPVAIEGLRSLLKPCEDLRIVGAVTSLLSGMDMVRTHTPAIVLIDKSFGLQAVMDWLTTIRAQWTGTAPIVWGMSMNEAEALRLVQAGAHGVIRKTAELPLIVECVRTVAGGHTWMEDCLFHEGERSSPAFRSNLTRREQQVAELVEQGLKNKDIASSLGIRPGTVKIHLKHIFEKTGVRGRYGLALTGLKEKGLLSLPPLN